jgi:hypothetical protein
VIHMNDRHSQTVAQLRAFLDGAMAWISPSRRPSGMSLSAARYGASLTGGSSAPRKPWCCVFGAVSGYSRQQVTRLVKAAPSRASAHAPPGFEHQFRHPLHGGGRACTGAHRLLARYALGIGDQEAHGASVGAVR